MGSFLVAFTGMLIVYSHVSASAQTSEKDVTNQIIGLSCKESAVYSDQAFIQIETSGQPGDLISISIGPNWVSPEEHHAFGSIFDKKSGGLFNGTISSAKLKENNLTIVIDGLPKGTTARQARLLIDTRTRRTTMEMSLNSGPFNKVTDNSIYCSHSLSDSLLYGMRNWGSEYQALADWVSPPRYRAFEAADLRLRKEVRLCRTARSAEEFFGGGDPNDVFLDTKKVLDVRLKESREGQPITDRGGFPAPDDKGAVDMLLCGIEEFLAFDDNPARIISQRILKITKHTVVYVHEMPDKLKREILESGYDLALEYYVSALYAGNETMVAPVTLKFVKRVLGLDRRSAHPGIQALFVRFLAITLMRGLYDDADNKLYLTELLELDRVIAETPQTQSVLGPLRTIISTLESKLRKTE